MSEPFGRVGQILAVPHFLIVVHQVSDQIEICSGWSTVASLDSGAEWNVDLSIALLRPKKLRVGDYGEALMAQFAADMGAGMSVEVYQRGVKVSTVELVESHPYGCETADQCSFMAVLPEGYPFRKYLGVRVPANGENMRCPCCHNLTLASRGYYEVCYICFWEDDGQDDIDADYVRGGPNGGLTLTQARSTYKRIGVVDERFVGRKKN